MSWVTAAEHTVPINALLTSFLLMFYSVHKLDHFWSRSAVHTSLLTADRRSGSQPAGREKKGQVGVHNVCERVPPHLAEGYSCTEVFTVIAEHAIRSRGQLLGSVKAHTTSHSTL